MKGSKFTLTGRHSRASYTLDTHYYLGSTPDCWGSYRAYAAPLYAARGEETVYSFVLLPLICFPDPRGPRAGAPAAAIHAHLVVLVTRDDPPNQRWVGCVGVAEFSDAADATEDWMNVAHHYSLLAHEDKFLYYPSETWERCAIPFAHVAESTSTAGTRKRSRSSASADRSATNVDEGHDHHGDGEVVPYRMPNPQPNVETEKEGGSSSSSADSPPQTPGALSAPAPVVLGDGEDDDLEFSDFFPVVWPGATPGSASALQLKNTDLFALSPDEFARKFWFVQRTSPKHTFPSVYHRYVLHCIEAERGDGDDGSRLRAAAATAARGWQLLSTSGLRETLRRDWPDWLRGTEAQWTRDTQDPRSELWSFRFDRLDACFERLGRRVLERVPWGARDGWSMHSPLLERFTKESIVHYCVDRCLPRAESRALIRTTHLPATIPLELFATAISENNNDNDGDVVVNEAFFQVGKRALAADALYSPRWRSVFERANTAADLGNGEDTTATTLASRRDVVREIFRGCSVADA